MCHLRFDEHGMSEIHQGDRGPPKGAAERMRLYRERRQQGLRYVRIQLHVTEIDDLIRTLNRSLGVTCVVVTHELESVFAIADRCIVLDDHGRGIIAEGNPRALRESHDPGVREFFSRRSRSS